MNVTNDYLTALYEGIKFSIENNDVEKTKLLMDFYNLSSTRLSYEVAEDCPVIPRANTVIVRIESEVPNFNIRTLGVTLDTMNPNKSADKEEYYRILKQIDSTATNKRVFIVGFGSYVKDLKLGIEVPKNMISNAEMILTNTANGLMNIASLLKDLKPNDPHLSNTSIIVDYFMVDSSYIKGTTSDKG